MTIAEVNLRLGRRLALTSVAASAALAAANIGVGLLARSTSLVAAGTEFAGDVLASAVVLLGMRIAALPPDADHPYGHGRSETIAGFLVGVILTAAGVGICFRSLQHVTELHEPPGTYAVAPLIGAVLVKGVLAVLKFHYGRRIGSSALVADAWNDAVDIISGLAALAALALTLYNPAQFLPADHYGGFAVGVIVIFTGVRVLRDTTLQLMDTMPDAAAMASVRRVAIAVPDVKGVEKCYARKTGLQYHVDLHLEVDPNTTVRESHNIATEVRKQIRRELPWVADVLVHVEPSEGWDNPPPAGRA